MTKWTKDNEGWVIEADRWENQDLVLAAPEMLEVLQEIVFSQHHPLARLKAIENAKLVISQAIQGEE